MQRGPSGMGEQVWLWEETDDPKVSQCLLPPVKQILVSNPWALKMLLLPLLEGLVSVARQVDIPAMLWWPLHWAMSQLILQWPGLWTSTVMYTCFSSFVLLQNISPHSPRTGQPTPLDRSLQERKIASACRGVSKTGTVPGLRIPIKQRTKQQDARVSWAQPCFPGVWNVLHLHSEGKWCCPQVGA